MESKDKHQKIKFFTHHVGELVISDDTGKILEAFSKKSERTKKAVLPTGDIQYAKLKLSETNVVKLPVLKSTTGEQLLDIRALYAQSGMFCYDPGYTITGSCVSTVSNSDSSGQLLYRGYPIEELVEKASYLEVCFLLLYGELPDKKDLESFEQLVKEEMQINQHILDFYKGFQQNAHPMSILCSVVGALSSFIHSTLDINDKLKRDFAAIKMIAKIPVLTAIAFRTSVGLPVVQPQKQMSYIENFLYMMFQDPMDADFKVPQIFVENMEKLFILHADNDQGPSTTGVRMAGSSLANPFAAMTAGIASLWGPVHGGANEDCLKLLKDITVEQIPEFLEQVKRKEKLLTGFGHRVYKTHDPRCVIIKDMIKKFNQQLGIQDPLFEKAMKLEEAATKDEYFVSRQLYPNIDFYSGILLQNLQMPQNMFNAFFTCSRTSGWVSHWREMMNESMIKIGRPRQVYVGQNLRQFEMLDDRDQVENFEIKMQL